MRRYTKLPSNVYHRLEPCLGYPDEMTFETGDNEVLGLVDYILRALKFWRSGMNVRDYEWKMTSTGTIEADDNWNDNGRLLVLRVRGVKQYYIDICPCHLNGVEHKDITHEDVKAIMDSIAYKLEERYGIESTFKLI